MGIADGAPLCRRRRSTTCISAPWTSTMTRRSCSCLCKLLRARWNARGVGVMVRASALRGRRHHGPPPSPHRPSSCCSAGARRAAGGPFYLCSWRCLRFLPGRGEAGLAGEVDSGTALGQAAGSGAWSIRAARCAPQQRGGAALVVQDRLCRRPTVTRTYLVAVPQEMRRWRAHGQASADPGTSRCRRHTGGSGRPGCSPGPSQAHHSRSSRTWPR